MPAPVVELAVRIDPLVFRVPLTGDRRVLLETEGLAAFLAVIVYGFVRLGRAPCYHTWASKVGAVACPLTLVPLLSGGASAPFHAAMVWPVLAGVEEIAIAVLIPEHSGEMPTVWHARRLRRSRAAGGGRV